MFAFEFLINTRENKVELVHVNSEKYIAFKFRNEEIVNKIKKKSTISVAD